MDYNTRQVSNHCIMVCFYPTKLQVQWIKCIIMAFLHVRNRVWNDSANSALWLSTGMPHHMQALPPHTAWVWSCDINIVSTLETGVVLHSYKVLSTVSMPYREVDIFLALTRSATLENISIPSGIQISTWMKIIGIHLTLSQWCSGQHTVAITARWSRVRHPALAVLCSVCMFSLCRGFLPQVQRHACLVNWSV